MFQILSLCHILLTESRRELRLESEEKPRVGHQMWDRDSHSPSSTQWQQFPRGNVILWDWMLSGTYLRGSLPKVERKSHSRVCVYLVFAIINSMQHINILPPSPIQLFSLHCPHSNILGQRLQTHNLRKSTNTYFKLGSCRILKNMN